MSYSQSEVGRWVAASGHLLLFIVFLFCLFDLVGLAERRHLLFSLAMYLVAIGCGVFCVFLGAAIPNMRFSSSKD